MTDRNKKKPKLHFGMRVVAILVTACCILFAWVGRNIQSARSETAAVARIQELGFDVSAGYGYSTDKSGQRVPGDASPGHPSQPPKLSIFECKQITKEDVDRIAKLLPNTKVRYTVAKSK